MPRIFVTRGQTLVVASQIGRTVAIILPFLSCAVRQALSAGATTGAASVGQPVVERA